MSEVKGSVEVPRLFDVNRYVFPAIKRNRLFLAVARSSSFLSDGNRLESTVAKLIVRSITKFAPDRVARYLFERQNTSRRGYLVCGRDRSSGKQMIDTFAGCWKEVHPNRIRRPIRHEFDTTRQAFGKVNYRANVLHC